MAFADTAEYSRTGLESGIPGYSPDDMVYSRNLVSFVGTTISHLPSLLFNLMHELCAKYGRSARCMAYPQGLQYDKETRIYQLKSDRVRSIRADAVMLAVSQYPDTVRENTSYLSVEMISLPDQDFERPAFLDYRGNSETSLAPRAAVTICADTIRTAIILRLNGNMKSRYYYTAKRFLRANRDKYVLPGMKAPEGRPWRVCVFDTEIERPYPIQFAGILLEKTEGAWREVSRYDTYIRMPEDCHLTRDVARVTSISEELLKEKGLSEDEADREIRSFLQQADILCGHAVIADKDIMRTSFMRQQLRLPYALRRHEMIDTQIILEKLFRLDGAVKLEYAAELVGVKKPEDVFHDARSDAAVTARILVCLEPEFVRNYGTEPVVYDAMMHSAQETQLLGRLTGQRTL